MSNEDIAIEAIPFWYPKDIALPTNADKGLDFVQNLWTKKQLIGLSTLWHAIGAIQDIGVQNQMKLVFSATISRVNLTYNLSMTRQVEGKKTKLGDGGSALFAQYRYWKPENIIELPVWDRFSDRFRRIARAKENWNGLTKDIDVNSNFQMINGSALDLAQYVTENSIDYIYTDPPYGGNIAYMDLSTMWNSWLFPTMFEGNTSVIDGFKKEEIIEGGDLKKSQIDYETLFSKSFEQMSIVLKKDKWLSCVFAHKKLEFWNVIIESCENGGIEFKGSVYQPTNNSSIHFKRNPTNVLCSQRIANFQKTNAMSMREKPDNLKEFILNEMERACLSGNGAYIDKIYQNVLDRLLQNKTLSEAKKKGYLNLNKLLDDSDLFSFDKETGQYFVKNKEDNYKAFTDDYFRKKSEVKVVLEEILTKHTACTIDTIYKELFEVFESDKKFPIDKEDIIEILNQIAFQNKKKRWILSKNKTHQSELNFDTIISNKLIKIKSDGLTHSETIFRLISIGGYLGFKSWIGKREQIADEFNGFKFSNLSLPVLPIMDKLSKPQANKIQQIDVIWFDKMGLARYAFEVEESTNIMTGLERFKFLLEFDSTIATHLFIVAPLSRRRKLIDTFTNSTYIGAPMYMENKVEFIFKEKLYAFYDSHIEKPFNEDDLKVIYENLKN